MDTIPSRRQRPSSAPIRSMSLSMCSRLETCASTLFEDGDLAFSLAGDWKDYELWFAWLAEGDFAGNCRLSMVT